MRPWHGRVMALQCRCGYSSNAASCAKTQHTVPVCMWVCVPQGSQTKPLSLDSVAADFPMSNESQLSSQSGQPQPQMPPPTEADGAMHTMLDPIDAEADADDDASSSEDESVEGTDGDAQA